MSFFSKLALTIGTAASLVAVTAPAAANPYYGGGYSRGGYGNYGGYGRGGYGGYQGGYRHRDNTGAILAGALLLGGIAAIAASSHHRDYDDRYHDNFYRGDGRAYGYYNRPNNGYYYERRSYEEHSYEPPYGRGYYPDEY